MGLRGCKAGTRRLWHCDIGHFVILAELCGNCCYQRARSHVQGPTAGEQRCECRAGEIWGGGEKSNVPGGSVSLRYNSRRAEWMPEFGHVLSEIERASMVA